MKAIIFKDAESPCLISETDKPIPQKDEVLVKIIASALNRRDYWIKKDIYQGVKFPCIVGSDGAGIVEEVGDDVDEGTLNKEVIINPGFNWGNHPDYHQKNFQILGLPRQGTLAEYVCVPVDSIWPKPAGWSFEKAAALPLAALTAYRALFTRGNLLKGENLLITGIGGGVAMFMLKFAVAIGANTYISSSSEKKLKKAIQLGALDGVLYTAPDWDQQLIEKSVDGFDLIADSAAGKNFEHFPTLLKLGGRIILFGGTAGKIPEITAAKIFWKQASILGTTMGSPIDFANMLEFVAEHKIEPEIDKIFPMEDTEIAFKHMENQEQFGKIVIKIS